MRILIFSVSLILSLQCYGQYHIGIGTNISSSRLNSISKKVIHSYGFSGADFDQKLNFEVSPYLQVRMTLKNNLGFELGIGYSTIKHKIELDYYYSFFQNYKFLENSYNMNLRKFVHFEDERVLGNKNS